MTAPLQEFGHAESPYDHPHRDWQCGWACEGRPCHIGPSSRGECRVDEECLPFPDGDGFRCGRPREFGGSCADGPLPDGSCPSRTPPCQPRLSLMARRGRAVFLVTSASLGLVLLLLGTATDSPGVISPGPLATGHQLLEQQCSACHAAADGMHSHVDLAAGGTTTDITGRCLTCHHEFGPHATRPHGMDPDSQAARTERALARGADHEPLMLRLTALGPGIPTEGDGTLSCVTCHDEHRGRNHDLRQMTNQQCQVCHANAFHDFGEGHPEFGDFPHALRANIAFDHARHYGEYFESFHRTMPNGRVPTACADCHRLDSYAGAMRTLDFEVTCASCHETQIEDRAFPGTPFVAVPWLDLPALSAAGVHVGKWPEGRGLPPRELPPFMELLLIADPEYRAAIAALGNVQLGDLGDRAVSQPAEVRRYALAIKRLFADIARDGESAIAARLRGTVAGGAPAQPSIVSPMISAQRRWFPGLAEELASLEAEPAPAPPPAAAEPVADAPDATDPVASPDAGEVPPANEPVAIDTGHDAPERAGGGWRIRDFDLTIRYRPNGHADPFLKHWLDDLVRSTKATPESASAEARGALGARATARFFDVLADPLGNLEGGAVASGRCLSCHGIGIDPDGVPRVLWQPVVETRSTIRFTEFRHDAHVREVLGSEDRGCRRCHDLREVEFAGTYRPEFFARDEATHAWHPVLAGPGTASGFQSIERKTCTACHIPSGAKNDCLQCHRYHVGHPR